MFKRATINIFVENY